MNGNLMVIPISLGFVNAYIVRQNNTVVLVDAGIQSSSGRIVKALKRNNIDIKDIAFIVITHGHSDHYGALSKIKKLSGAKVIAHEDEVQSIQEGINSEIVFHNGLAKLLVRLFDAQKVEPCMVDIVLYKSDGDVFDLTVLGIEGKILHTPGHTGGSISLIFDNHAAIIGDMITIGHFTGKLDLPNIYTNLEALRSSLEKVLIYEPDIIFPSHCKAFNLKQLRQLLEKSKLQ